MSVVFTNEWAVINRDKVFVNDASYQAQLPMTGRRDALGAICDAITAKETCLAISDHLGAGKSFVVKNAIRELVADNKVEEERDIAWMFPDQMQDGSRIKQAKSPVIIIDDLDRKIDLRKIENCIKQARDWIEGRQDKTAILIGDYTVRSLQLTESLAREKAISWVPLEPLEWPLLNAAIADRAAHHIAGATKGLNAIDVLPAVREQVATMFSDELRYALLPPTDPSVANFRDIFGILQAMAEKLPLSSDPCGFSGETYRKWTKRYRIEVSEQRQRKFLEQLHEIIVERAKRGEPWRALGVEEWSALMSDRADPIEYLDEVLEPLARAQILLPMGIPYYPPERRAYPPPYLPTVKTFMAALLGRPL
jgi:hypothetical protein